MEKDEIEIGEFYALCYPGNPLHGEWALAIDVCDDGVRMVIYSPFKSGEVLEGTAALDRVRKSMEDVWEDSRS